MSDGFHSEPIDRIIVLDLTETRLAVVVGLDNKTMIYGPAGNHRGLTAFMLRTIANMLEKEQQ